MIFQRTWQKVLSGEKTQTRRIVKPGHRELFKFWSDGTHKHIDHVWNEGYNDRLVYQVGKTYAVQPGRGKPTIWYAALRTCEGTIYKVVDENSGNFLDAMAQPLRIRITAIRREDVRDISNEDVQAEGFSHARDFLHAWIAMHDKPLARQIWGETKLMARPAERYQAWAISFEVVK